MAVLAKASTTEFGPTDEPSVGLITEWMSEEGLQKREAGGDLGGTMRLGAYPAKLTGNSVVASIYENEDISERHRHRYEVNAHYRDLLEKGGLIFSGMSPDGTLPEIVERRSEAHTSELQSLMRISYAVFCLQKKNTQTFNANPQR